MQQRSGAPLDREVDPWGSTKLRKHLNQMWYGRSEEERQTVVEEASPVDYQSVETIDHEKESFSCAASWNGECSSTFRSPSADRISSPFRWREQVATVADALSCGFYTRSTPLYSDSQKEWASVALSSKCSCLSPRLDTARQLQCASRSSARVTSLGSAQGVPWRQSVGRTETCRPHSPIQTHRFHLAPRMSLPGKSVVRAKVQRHTGVLPRPLSGSPPHHSRGPSLANRDLRLQSWILERPPEARSP